MRTKLLNAGIVLGIVANIAAWSWALRPAEAGHRFATCTGSSTCKACKNCKYCKHCNAGGGKCGVCR